MRKHIILYVNSMQPSGGIERVVATLAKKLSETYKISILVKDEPKSFYHLPENVEILSLNYPLLLNMNSRVNRIVSLTNHLWGIRKKLTEIINKINPDYIYITSPYACLEAYLAKIPKEKLIISEHGARINYNFVYRFLKNILYKRYNIHIVPTMADYTWYKKQGFPSFYIPHFRSDLPYEKSSLSSKIVLNIGRLTDDKQQLMLLKIWNKIIRNGNIDEWKLRIVGQGENYSILTDYIKNQELDKYVEILLPSPHVGTFYKNASIYVSSSRSEGFPMVLIEAISFGLPTIAFDCPTGPNEILNNETGILVSLNDEDTFALELEKMILNSDLRESYSNKAFKRSEDWNDKKILEKWGKILN